MSGLGANVTSDVVKNVVAGLKAASETTTEQPSDKLTEGELEAVTTYLEQVANVITTLQTNETEAIAEVI